MHQACSMNLFQKSLKDLSHQGLILWRPVFLMTYLRTCWTTLSFFKINLIAFHNFVGFSMTDAACL
nr:hypothetical protein DCAR_022673 [Ipomoea batatas]